MSSGAQDIFSMVRTKIRIDGGPEVNFTNLQIQEELASVNGFSFHWRQEGGDPSLQGHVEFYKKHLSKPVSIAISDSYNFEGVIDSINCIRQDELGVEYQLSGTGLGGKLDEVPECAAFSRKGLKHIFDAANKAQGVKLKLQPKNTSELFYTVQYNQTAFEFYKMLAARHGEWMYYNGRELVLGAPDNKTVELKIDMDVHDISINATIRNAGIRTAGFDPYRGEPTNDKAQKPSSSSGLIEAAVKGGENAFGDNHSPAHLTQAANKQLLTRMNELRQKAIAASAVTVSGASWEPKVKIGARIKLVLGNNKSEGEYYITSVRHTAISDNSYENHFTAIPAEAEVPPYTDPFLHPVCRPQPALVTHNEDKDGLDRIKVTFPWMENGVTTPWLNVVTPHAGKDKGIRFLPELDEEVLVGFVDNNAEQPFILGAVHTEKSKSGDVVTGNKIKTIGTQSGRRMEINEEDEFLQLSDNFKGKTPKNVIRLTRDNSTTQIAMMSMKDDNNTTVMQLNNSESVKIGVQNNGQIIAEILLEKDGQKITVHSKGTVDIKGEQAINLSAPNISINASQELKMEGKAKGAELKGLKVDVAADTSMELKGLNVKVEGTAKLDLSSAAMASMAAALVKIN